MPEISEAEKVWQLCLFAKQAYNPKSISFTDYYTSDTFNLGVGVLEDGCKVVACAGSADIRDWIDDATAIPFWMPELGVTMHLGFTEGYKEAFAWLLPKIAGGAAFVGHSMGGPHSALLAVLAAKQGIPVDMLVLLESPRPGFQAFADLANSLIPKIYSFRNARDPVVHVPAFIFRWRHILEVMVDLNHPAPGIDPFDDHCIENVLAGLLTWRDAQQKPVELPLRPTATTTTTPTATPTTTTTATPTPTATTTATPTATPTTLLE